MEDFTNVVKPLRELSRGKIFMWMKKTVEAFDKLKERLIRPPEEGGLVLTLPQWERQFVLDTDASKYAVGAVLSQWDGDKDKEGKLRPVMFISRKLTDAEVNYCTRDREALAIVWAFKRLRRYLRGAPNVRVRTDHANLRWLMELEHTGRLARWQIQLSVYDFQTEHIKGVLVMT